MELEVPKFIVGNAGGKSSEDAGPTCEKEVEEGERTGRHQSVVEAESQPKP